MAKAPFVAMQTDLRKEDRVDVIASVTGFNEDEVIGKLFRLWARCTDRGLEDAPPDCDGYAVSERVVQQFLGPRGVAAILGDGCDELAMGERRPDGLIYLRGTHETVSRLRALRSTAVTGGRSAAGQNGRDVGGRFVRNQQIIQPTVQPEPSRPPAADQPSSSHPPAGEPAVASEIPQTTDHRSEEDTDQREASPRRVRQPSGDHQLAIDAFDQRYRARYGRGYDWLPKDFGPISRLVKSQGLPEVERRTAILFDAPPSFLAESPPDIGTLVKFWNKLVEPSRGRQAARARDPTSGRVEPKQPHEYEQGDQKL